MFTFHRSIRTIATNNILNIIGRRYLHYSKVCMNEFVYEESKQIYNYNKVVDTIESKKTITIITATTKPVDYKNEYFWLEIVENNRYAFGIKNEFISEYGNIDYVNINLNPMKRLSYKQYFGDIENNKTIYTLDAPFDNCFVVNNNENTSLELINSDPENIKHHIGILEHHIGIL